MTVGQVIFAAAVGWAFAAVTALLLMAVSR